MKNAPAHIDLYTIDCRLWLPQYDHFLRLLSPQEKEKAARFHFKKDEQRFVLARGLLRHQLAEYLGCTPTSLVFKKNAHEKPFVENTQSLHFNISHSGDFVLFAFSWDLPVGIDIEYQKPHFDFMPIAQRFFAPQEIEQLCALEMSLQRSAFFDLWSQKEAVIKAIGQGLSYPLKDFTLAFTKNNSVHLQSIKNDDPKQWCLQKLNIDEQYSSAVAMRTAWFDINRLTIKA
jgi:4'-phosphopantetheinyl transferase